MKKQRAVWMALGGATLLFWAGISWLGGAQQPASLMQGDTQKMQGVGTPMQGGALQGVSANGQSDGTPGQSPVPPAFAVPAEGPFWVGPSKPGAGKITPYSATAPQTPQGAGLYSIVNPSSLGELLAQQPGITAALNQSSALQVTDASGASMAVTSGQLQGFLPLLADPQGGYSGTLDLSQLSAEQQSLLVNSGAIAPVQNTPGSSSPTGAAGPPGSEGVAPTPSDSGSVSSDSSSSLGS